MQFIFDRAAAPVGGGFFNIKLQLRRNLLCDQLVEPLRKNLVGGRPGHCAKRRERVLFFFDAALCESLPNLSRRILGPELSLDFGCFVAKRFALVGECELQCLIQFPILEPA